MTFRIVSWIGVAVLLAGGGTVLAQADLRVPSQYPDVQAAINAAQPGDRILLEPNAQALSSSFGSLLIDKSLTIESDTPGTQRFLGIQGASTITDGTIVVTGLTPGIPLVLRDVDIWYSDAMFSGVSRLGFRARLAGEIRMDNVFMMIHREARPEPLVDVDITQLWLRGCRFVGISIHPDNPCHDPTFWPWGGDAVRARADKLIMEDCVCIAGDAAYLWYYAPCNPPQQYGNGGAALVADTASTVLTRCQFQDGNGSWFQPGPWISLPQTFAGQSIFVRQGGVLLAYDALHTVGLDGQVGPAPTNHGPTRQVGDVIAPLLVGESRLMLPFVYVTARVGLFAQDISIVAIGVDWGPTSTPIGTVAIDPVYVLATYVFTPPWSTSFLVPSNPSLVNLPLIGQLAYVSNGNFVVSNPSGVWLRR